MLVELVCWILFAVLIPFVWLHYQIKQPKVVPISNPTNNESAVYRHIKSTVDLCTPKIKTLYELMRHSCQLYKNRPLFGQRSIVKIVEEEKQVKKMVAGEQKIETKVWKYFQLSEYQWVTYHEVYQQINQVGCALRYLGLQPKDKLTLFAPTTKDWMIMAHGCFTQNITITTAYDTLGEEGLAFSLNEAQVHCLFTSAELVAKVPKIHSLAPHLKTVIFNGELSNLDAIQKQCPTIQFKSLDDLLELGKEHPCAPTEPTFEDVCCIMYTSGSTGNPKGVVITHENMMTAISGAEQVIHDYLRMDDVYLAYLPLAHILEFLVESFLIYAGVPLGYGNPKTLTDASVRNCQGDIKELSPTLMAGVPAVWESIRKGVQAKLNDLKPIQRKLFDTCFALKWKFLKLGLPCSIFDKLVFQKIKNQTGGRLRFALSGGAPIPKDTHQFLTVCICDVFQGYGLTETCGFLALQDIDQSAVTGSVGMISPAAEFKLVSVKEANYDASNSTKPQGEIWVRSKAITTGYYNQPELTRETFTDDWFMTGDIGQVNPDGTLSIIDRKKNLVKLSHGEYIAIEKLESVYKTSSLVQNICVYADPEHSKAVALVLPIEKPLLEHLSNNGIHCHDLEHASDDKKAVGLVFQDLLKVAASSGLKGAELIGDCRLCFNDWTPQNGMLTAAMKLQRRNIVKEYRHLIDEMLGSS